MCSVSLGDGGELLDLIELDDGYSHAENLAAFVDEILKRNRLSVHNLDAVAVSSGPGSYTGLRIGVSLAKGICFGAQKPLIAINTLCIMCLHPNVRNELQYLKDPILCPMVDARRMEVYTALYDIGLKVLKPTEAMILDQNSFMESLTQDAVLFFGSGSEKFKELVASKSAYFADTVVPSAAQMTILSEMDYNQNKFENLAYFEPEYVKAVHTTTPKKTG